ncbi:hypothetical protein XaC1_26 [Xanthomonas phage XaC1]|nr:hypothetical protein XaC1_26 [Xanthomonas phage XaC1]
MVRLKKGSLVGTLKITPREHYTMNGCDWRDCLALVDDSGNWLNSTWFRPNAHKKALSYFLENGWSVENGD